MKKLLLIIAVFICVGFITASPPPATPGKIEIIFRVPARHASNFRQAFLAYIPNNEMMLDPASTPENPLPDIKKYTNRQHFRNEIRSHMFKCAERGNDILRDQIDQFVTDPNMIEME